MAASMAEALLMDMPRPESLREQEAAVSRQEIELQEALAQAESDAEVVAARLEQLHNKLDKTQATRGAGAELAALAQEIESAHMPVLEVREHFERALAARRAALQARAQMSDAIGRSLETYTTALQDLRARIAASAAALETMAKRPVAAPVQAPVAQPVEAVRVPPPLPVADGMEQRRSTRVQLEAVVDLSSDDNFFTGFSTDVSTGGLFVATINLLPRGTPIDLRFSLPTGEVIETSGEVRWTREWNDATPGIYPGMGIQFQELADGARVSIGRFVARRDPLFFAD